MASESCPVAHNPAAGVGRWSDRERERVDGATLSWAGRVCELQWMASPQPAVGGGPRGEVRGWSAASRRRFLKYMASLDLAKTQKVGGGRFVFLTLTYRDDPGCDRFKRDLDAFQRALRHYFGSRELRAVWKVEFQRRGVPHVHILLDLHSTSSSALTAFRGWCWATWHQVTGGYPLERAGGGLAGALGRNRIDVDFCMAKDVARYIACDQTSDAKGYQYRVPKTWDRVGRWWGHWGLVPEWRGRKVSYREYVFARRVLRRHRQANASRKVKFGRSRLRRLVSFDGEVSYEPCESDLPPTKLWVIGDDVGTLSGAVLRLIEGMKDGQVTPVSSAEVDGRERFGPLAP